MVHRARNPPHRTTEATVVGAGIIGLTTALAMRAAGMDVRIVAQSVSPNTLSNIAAAIWYPFEVNPRERVLGWASRSLAVFAAEARNGIPGVSTHEMVDLFATPVPDPWWAAAVPEWRRCGADDLPEGYVDGLISRVPRVESTPYLNHLHAEVDRNGIQIEQKRVASLADLDARLVVNCAGLAAGGLCGDEGVYPIRGVVLRTSKLDTNRSVSDDTGPNSLAYVIPRSNDGILGGTAQRGSFELQTTDAEVADIIRRCTAICPAVSAATILEAKVGLRPGRASVRCEIDHSVLNVIHNYGHGGAGFTLCWGCADEVVSLAEAFFAEA
jgi:D-amino-acid oxidase